MTGGAQTIHLLSAGQGDGFHARADLDALDRAYAWMFSKGTPAWKRGMCDGLVFQLRDWASTMPAADRAQLREMLERTIQELSR